MSAVGTLLTALASTITEKTCLAGFQQFGDKCITTVNTGYGLSGGTLNMMECAENCGYLARPYVDEISIPGTIWTLRSRAASCAERTPATVSWSVIEITSRPPLAAPCTTAAGHHAPSEAVV